MVTFRNLQTTSILREDPLSQDTPEDAPKKFVFDVSSLGPKDRNTYDHLSPEEKLEYEDNTRKLDEHMNSPKVQSELTAEASTAAFEVSQEIDPEDFKTPYVKVGFMAMGEEDEQGTGEDEDFEGDDISSTAHGELEQHREMREYARIAAWEMPLLSSEYIRTRACVIHDTADLIFIEFAQTFRQPGLEAPLRFRYTTYMGETHPAQNKIVLEFCTSDLPGLENEQRIKFIKLVGPRYNPQTDIVKMSCEMFQTQDENKTYLRDLVRSLISEAQDSSDTFKDVPLDFRHHKFKRPLKFPESWKMTPERKENLESEREKNLIAEQGKQLKGEVVNGVVAIEKWVHLVLSSQREPNSVFFDKRKGPPPPRFPNPPKQPAKVRWYDGVESRSRRSAGVLWENRTASNEIIFYVPEG